MVSLSLFVEHMVSPGSSIFQSDFATLLEEAFVTLKRTYLSFWQASIMYICLVKFPLYMKLYHVTAESAWSVYLYIKEQTNWPFKKKEKVKNWCACLQLLSNQPYTIYPT